MIICSRIEFYILNETFEPLFCTGPGYDIEPVFPIQTGYDILIRSVKQFQIRSFRFGFRFARSRIKFETPSSYSGGPMTLSPRWSLDWEICSQFYTMISRPQIFANSVDLRICAKIKCPRHLIVLLYFVGTTMVNDRTGLELIYLHISMNCHQSQSVLSDEGPLGSLFQMSLINFRNETLVVYVQFRVSFQYHFHSF